MKDNENFKVSFVAIVLVLMFLFTVSVLVQPGISGNEKGNFIQNFDQDKDGKVSKEEFRGSDRAFNRFDRNQDGYIDETEVPKGPPTQGQKAGPPTQGQKAGPPPQGQKAGPPPQGARGGGFIQDFDQDKDGKLSREEFRGSDQGFNRLDRNRDGFVDEMEVPKGPPTQRPKKKAE